MNFFDWSLYLSSRSSSIGLDQKVFLPTEVERRPKIHLFEILLHCAIHLKKIFSSCYVMLLRSTISEISEESLFLTPCDFTLIYVQLKRVSFVPRAHCSSILFVHLLLRRYKYTECLKLLMVCSLENSQNCKVPKVERKIKFSS